MGEATLLLIKALIFGMIFTWVLGFFFIRYMSKHTETAVSRLNRETEDVRHKQVELNEKIKEASEELVKRRKEADALVAKMKEDAEDKATQEREKIIQKARQDAEEIINKAHHTKDQVRKELEKEMKLQAIDYCILLMEQFFTSRSFEALDASLIAEFFTDMESVDMEMIGPDVQSIDVMTARPLSDTFEQRLTDILFSKLERKFQVNKSVQKEIIGGILLKFGTLSLDGSLKSVLRNTAEEVKEKLEKGLI
jgi:F0F1-type ATP synthase membrane subunit b/b'